MVTAGRITKELKNHAPFTVAGAVSGIALMFIFQNIPEKTAYNIFYILHPAHVILSALVTASMYKIYKCGKIKGKCSLLGLFAIGYIGSIGIATLSDSIIPYFAEWILKMPDRHTHIGFIEKWWLINPLAIAGIAIAYFYPGTKFPHSGHVFVSTWASLFHIIMAKGAGYQWYLYPVIFIFLFAAVWLPCCISDIVFPLLFVDEKSPGGHD
ncbi:MAG: hypothetical protein PHO00_05940 [bacterium]|nr:hypothetical protein [bacterium]